MHETKQQKSLLSCKQQQVQAVNSNRDRKGKGRKIKERKLRLATWNIQGWRTKREEVLEEFKNMNVDILVVTETKKKGNGTEEIGGALHIWSGNKTWEPVNERVIRVEIAIYGRDVIIIGAYGPNDDSPVTEKEKFLDTIQNEIANIRKKELIIAGDLNGREGRKENDSAIGRFGEEITNDNGERVIEICQLNDLKVTNGFFRHKDIHRYTWTQETRELKSIIDYIIIRRRSTIKIRDVRVQRGAECGSDHRLLLAKMEFPWMNRKTNNIEGTPIEIQKRSPLKYNYYRMNPHDIYTKQDLTRDS
ncbi:craniofacial development protein 2-like [Sitophilus oryzae]|uniref:Craniofacial development protein 2-like n=1 Tax=Sitophilus oryzae TaxID=7048 RepID=A0A6J2X9N3_SITOR|nr:craniofacial development protein 2-like [Sitophilus oryzae]